jgi:cytochrome P450
MPYTSALILEVLRKSSLTPFGIVHNTLDDVTFHGYRIPKDTIILANLYEVHQSEKIWGDPENFRPERFLSEDGSELLKDHPKVIPFSVGKRSCLGETLARNNLFLFLTSLFQTFDILKDPSDKSKFDVDEPAGLFRFPPHFKVIFHDRQE